MSQEHEFNENESLQQTREPEPGSPESMTNDGSGPESPDAKGRATKEKRTFFKTFFFYFVAI